MSDARIDPALLALLLDRELLSLAGEVEAYPDDEALWAEHSGVANPGGTLALHCVGNLQNFIGATLGGTKYVRLREEEFRRRDLSKADLLDEIATTRRVVSTCLAALDAEAMQREFPIAFGELRLRSDVFLCHLLSHLSYHLGQIDYHRRLVGGSTQIVPALSIPALAT